MSFIDTLKFMLGIPNDVEKRDMAQQRVERGEAEYDRTQELIEYYGDMMDVWKVEGFHIGKVWVKIPYRNTVENSYIICKVQKWTRPLPREDLGFIEYGLSWGPYIAYTPESREAYFLEKKQDKVRAMIANGVKWR